MNNIVFAGRVIPPHQNSAEKYCRIILPSARGKMRFEGGALDYNKGDFIVVPPLFKFSRTQADANEIQLHIERALLPYREARIFKDAGGGMAQTAALAVYYFEDGGFPAVLSSLGGLAIAFATDFDRDKKYSPAVNAIRAEIEKNLSDSGFSLEDCLAKLPLNYDYLRKLFKKEVGISPHEYLISMRMERAKSIILSGTANRYSNYTVSQIAEACGFLEPLYFSRVFKKYFGVSPSEYAK